MTGEISRAQVRICKWQSGAAGERGDKIPLGVSEAASSTPSEVFNVPHVRPRGHTLKAFNERASSHLRRSTLPSGTDEIRREKDAPGENERGREGVARVGERETGGWSECR